MKPILLTGFQDGAVTASEPIIMTWNGVEMPKVLRTLRDDVLRPVPKAA